MSGSRSNSIKSRSTSRNNLNQTSPLPAQLPVEKSVVKKRKPRPYIRKRPKNVTQTATTETSTAETSNPDSSNKSFETKSVNVSIKKGRPIKTERKEEVSSTTPTLKANSLPKMEVANIKKSESVVSVKKVTNMEPNQSLKHEVDNINSQGDNNIFKMQETEFNFGFDPMGNFNLSQFVKTEVNSNTNLDLDSNSNSNSVQEIFSKTSLTKLLNVEQNVSPPSFADASKPSDDGKMKEIYQKDTFKPKTFKRPKSKTNVSKKTKFIVPKIKKNNHKSRSHMNGKIRVVLHKIDNNPFINFLRMYKYSHGKWNACKVAVEGSKRWCNMNMKQRQKFILKTLRKNSPLVQKKSYAGSRVSSKSQQFRRRPLTGK